MKLLIVTVVVNVLMALVAATNPFAQQTENIKDLLEEENFIMKVDNKYGRYERLPFKPNDSLKRHMDVYPISPSDRGFTLEEDALFGHLHREKRQALEEEASGSVDDGVETRVRVTGSFSTANANTVKADLTTMLSTAYSTAEVDQDRFTVTVTNPGGGIMLATIKTFFTSENRRIHVAYATRKYVQGNQIGEFPQSQEPTVINAADQERTLTCFLCAPGYACAAGASKCAARPSSTSATELFPWGFSTNDDKLTHVDLASSPTITLPFDIAFNVTAESYLAIGDKGVISFPQTASSSGYNSGSLTNISAVTEKIVCAFCADIDQSLSGYTSEIFYHVYAVHDGTEETIVILNRATAEVRAQFDSTFTAQQVVVATWWNVPYGVATSTAPTGRNTFQAVIITDGKYSFLMLFYKDMEWPQDNQDNALAGFKYLLTSALINYKLPKSANDQRTSINFEDIPGTGTGNTGFFFVRLGTIESPSTATVNKQACGNWFQSNFPSRDGFKTNLDSLALCNCAKNHINSNSAFSRLSGTLNSRTCYDKITSPGDYGLRCCYSGNALDKGWHSRYLRFRSGDQYTNSDLTPVNKCCLDVSGMCQLVRIVRPLNACDPASSVSSAAGVGDPHITSIDGFGSTINPVGEFTMIIMDSTPEAFRFEFQSRMETGIDSDGSVTEATFFTGFAARQTGSQPFHGGSFFVKLNEDGSDFVVFVNDKDVTNQYRQNLPYPDLEGKIAVSRPETASIRFTFPLSDISITVNRFPGYLSHKTDIPRKHIGKSGVTVKGLMGNADMDKTNDLIKKNGDTLATTASEEELFQFANTWRVTEAESIFKYDTKTYTEINNLQFTPKFMSTFTAAQLESARVTCGGLENAECVLDFVLTGNPELASQTKDLQKEVTETLEAQANVAPTINGKDEWKVKVGVAATTTYTATDPDDTVVTFKTSSKPASLALNEDTGVVTWTPPDTTPVSFVINALDARLMASEPKEVLIVLCEDCKNGAPCDYTLKRDPPGADAPENFKLATCVCTTGWGGSDCSQDIDSCVTKPCGETRACSDQNPTQEATTGLAFTCGDCPAGYSSPVGSYKCFDVNECEGSHGCPANSVCENTEGSFVCNCNSGFRKKGEECTDINECAESTSDCTQICENTEGSFTCSCYAGFTTADSGKTCSEPAVTPSVCTAFGCNQICIEVGGAAKCKCRTGFILGDDDKTCQNINECDLGLCTQDCADTEGSYSCSCFDGYSLAADGILCEKCVVPSWGPSCGNTCDCKGRATRCDSVKGCLCEPTWSGVSCEIDVDECTVTADICGLKQICENIDGGYKCNCPAGFAKDGSDCVDIDECAADIFPCDPNADCVNTVGSYSCVCKPGFVPNGDACDDINECTNGVAMCEQTCANTGGSFNCQCRQGYTLNDDRFTCKAFVDVCGGDQGCAHYCVLEGDVPTCKCNNGYELAADTRGCNDIDECANAALNLCTDKSTCNNLAGGFECSCPLGQKLENDKRTCAACDDNFWGLNCVEECGCDPKGAASCNKQTGCVCNSGWAGEKCGSDINECDSTTCPENSDCNNLPGSYECKCRNGFVKSADGTACEDVDECANPLANECDKTCENTVGDYTCSCSVGYLLEGKGKCVDIDECALLTSGCQQDCVNIDGSFVCECFEGFDFNPADRSQCIQNADSICSAGHGCGGNCRKIESVDTCYCDTGYTLNADGKACDDNDECTYTPALCSGTCSNTPAGSYTCACNDGFSVAADGTTCTACITNKWGPNCANTCLCKPENTVSCNSVDGTCDCRGGWDGATCETDVLECANLTICGDNGVCTEQAGGYQCSCQPGYLRTEVCTQCQAFKYGVDCGQTCACDATDAESCSNVDGTCTCKPEWTGSDCKTDVDECSIDGRVTCGDNEVCNNLVGSYECACTTGYVKSPTTDACVPCNLGSYGEGCLLSCDCEVGHINSCDNIVGTCNCTSGWIGSRCETNVDECSQDPPVCPSNLDTCNDTAGSYECLCIKGYQKNAADQCVVCDFGKYDDCVKDCPCTIANIDSCNNINGSCSCKSGWSGNSCDTDIDECALNTHTCNTTISTCRNTNGAYVCDCKTGYETSGGVCVPCGFGKYDDCVKDCPCTIANIDSCNNINGSCSCKSGWSGNRCDTNIDECVTNTHTCNTTISTCRDTDGAYVCDCKTGYVSEGVNNCIDINECATDAQNTCTYICSNTPGSYFCSCPLGHTGSQNNCSDISLTYRVVYVLNMNRLNVIQLGPSNVQYQNLANIIRNIIIGIIQPILGDSYVPPTITSLESGSVISNVVLKIDPSKTSIPNNLAAAAARALASQSPVDVDGTSAPVASVKVNDINVGQASNPCDVLRQLQNLGANEYCEVSDSGVPYLRKLDTSETDVPLIIGLTVPFALILIIVVALLVYFCCCRSPYKTYGQKPPSDEGRDNLAFRSAFAGNLPTKGNFGASRYMMYSPHTLSETASQASGEGYKVIRPKTLEGRSDFLDMPAQSERNYQQFSSPRDGWEDNGRSNFSWENMFNTLEPSRNPPFEVPRPNVSNSPARVYRGNGRYDSLA